MPIVVGTQNIGDLFVGGQKISEVYVGSQLVYTSAPPNTPFDYQWTDTAQGVWINATPQVISGTHPVSSQVVATTGQYASIAGETVAPSYTLPGPYQGNVRCEVNVAGVTGAQGTLTVGVRAGGQMFDVYRGSWGNIPTGVLTEDFSNVDLPEGSEAWGFIAVSGSSSLSGLTLTCNSFRLYSI